MFVELLWQCVPKHQSLLAVVVIVAAFKPNVKNADKFNLNSPIYIFISVINQLHAQKFCASSWLITETNILRCTVRKSQNLQYVVSLERILDILQLLQADRQLRRSQLTYFHLLISTV